MTISIWLHGGGQFQVGNRQVSKIVSSLIGRETFFLSGTGKTFYAFHFNASIEQSYLNAIYTSMDIK